MPAMQGQPPPRYETAFKVQVINEALEAATSREKLADMRGVSVSTITNWVSREKEIRKTLEKELKVNGKGGNGHATNGHTKANGKLSTGHKPPALDSATPKKRKGLRIIGLDALVAKMVAAEVERQLPALVKQELGAALKKAFAEQVTSGP